MEYKTTMIRGEQYQGLLYVGQRIHSALHGGRDGVIYRITGEQRPETIRSIGFGGVMGGNAQVYVVFEDGIKSSVTEAIIRGVQWYISEEIAGQQKIDNLLKFAESEKIRKDAESVVNAANRAELRQKILKKYHYLTPCKTSKKNPATKNIKQELKKAFPEVTFSVRGDHNSIAISWDMGPTIQDVENISGKYQEGRFDGMNDIYEYDNENVWPDVFGGAKYINCSRSYRNSGKTYEDETKFLNQVASDLAALKEETYVNLPQKFYSDAYIYDTYRDIVFRLLRRTDLTKGYHGVRRTGVTCGHIEEFYEIY